MEFDVEENGGVDLTLHDEDLPEQLREVQSELQDIIRSVDVPADMPDGQNYPEAEQPTQIGWVLMDILGTHMFLRHRAVKFVYRSSLRDKGKPAVGKSTKCGAKLRELSGVEFLVEINLDLYRMLPPHRKIRTIDHELCHLAVDEDEQPDFRAHDIEEFREIAQRWGLKPGLQQQFGETIAQLNLFDNKKEVAEPSETEAVPF